MSEEESVGAVVLAAGRSSRMRGNNKLMARLDGRPLAATVASCALSSHADPVIVVLGHRADELRDTMPEGVTIVENPSYTAGLSSSLRAGIRALPDRVSGALVMLGDMPLVRSSDIDALIEAHEPGSVCVPLVEGRWGNPILWSRGFFARMMRLEGDRGARRILDESRDRVIEVALHNRGLLHDVDTLEDLEWMRSSPEARDSH